MIKHRILVVDDNRAIHEDFRKILCPVAHEADSLAESELALFGASTPVSGASSYELDYAFQGDEALERVRRAQAEHRPYSMAFIDVRMPPGWDGIETTARIWECDSDIQVVICTAYSDYSWKQMLAKLGHSDRLVILKKPFDNIEVLQLADGLTHKWNFAQRTKQRVTQLEQLLTQRTAQLKESTLRLQSADSQLLSMSDYDHQALNTQRQQRLVLESKLKQAIEQGVLSVHYQPLFDIATRKIVSLEALARWTDAEQGPISPAEFIPLAEETGLILPLGEFVLSRVCEQLVKWQSDGVPVVPVAVNISAVQMQQQQLGPLVLGVLKDTGVSPDLLSLELTESTLIKDTQRHIGDLKALRTQGVKIEIDDFGTGYSSLSYLRRLPIDTLKIDRSFIRDVDSNPADESIVHAILAMAHTLGLQVIAEGVETATQLEVLRLHGCEFAQGFYFSRPLPADACRKLLVELAERPAFTETLRLRLMTDAQGLSRPALRKPV